MGLNPAVHFIASDAANSLVTLLLPLISLPLLHNFSPFSTLLSPLGNQLFVGIALAYAASAFQLLFSLVLAPIPALVVSGTEGRGTYM